MVNREQEMVTYRIEVRLEGVKLNETAPFELTSDARWEEPISFTPVRAGTDLKLEFFLFREGQTGPYLKPLYIWLEVS